ncbi:MAG: GntR family transcriptional regulator, partial [Actinomycetota bacterium]
MAQLSANELVAEVERRIAAGDLAPGDRLPSVRSVAAER